MGIFIALAAKGIIPLSSVLPILYGQNIGTCVTSLISSIGAKRAAIMHLFFNIIGIVMFLIFFNKSVISIVTKIDPSDVARQLANIHTLFNIVSVIILLPFSKFIVKLSMIIIPEGVEEKKGETYIDERILETPSIAFGNTIKKTLKMDNLSKECLNNSMNSFLDKSQKYIDKAIENEKSIKNLQINLLSYLLKLSKTSINSELLEDVDNLFNTINDLKRIGDHYENISEFAEDAIKEINEMYEKVKQNCEDIISAIKNKDTNIASKIMHAE